jgi:hypothetical protein
MQTIAEAVPNPEFNYVPTSLISLHRGANYLSRARRCNLPDSEDGC